MFSDEDLKRVKKISIGWSAYGIDLEGLLARLEAAEKMCRFTRTDILDGNGESWDSEKVEEAEKAWLKAAGK